MNVAEGSSSSLHLRLVRSLVEYMNANGWTVTHADGVSAYPQPYEVGGRVPDVIARNSQGLIAFGEAETCDTLKTEQTTAQLDAFSSRVMNDSNETVPLYVVVPESCRGGLSALLLHRFPKRSNVMQLYMNGA